MLDAQVCGDGNAHLAFRTKVEKYSAQNQAIIRFSQAAGAPQATRVEHLPCVFTFRGVVHGETFKALSARGFPPLDVSDCCLLALSGSAKASAAFFGGT